MTKPGQTWNETLPLRGHCHRRTLRATRLRLRRARSARERARVVQGDHPRRSPPSRAQAPEPVALRGQPAQGRPRRHHGADLRPARGQREGLHDAHLRHRARAGRRRRQEGPHRPLLRLRRPEEERVPRHPPVHAPGREDEDHPGHRRLRERHPARRHRVQEPHARREVEERGHRADAPLPGDRRQLPRARHAEALRDGPAHSS